MPNSCLIRLSALPNSKAICLVTRQAHTYLSLAQCQWLRAVGLATRQTCAHLDSAFSHTHEYWVWKRVTVMSFGSNILPSLWMLGMKANPSHLSMDYHLVFKPFKQGLRLKKYFFMMPKNVDPSRGQRYRRRLVHCTAHHKKQTKIDMNKA